MKSRILGLLAVGLLAGPLSAQAAVITEVFTVTVNSASVGYSAGHVFTITATYSNPSTVMNGWSDGVNGVAEFGGGDDSLDATFPIDNSGFTLFSNATISISGLTLPAGATKRDVRSTNYSWYFENPTAWYISFYADDLELYLTSAGDFLVHQYYSSNAGNNTQFSQWYGTNFSVTRRVATAAPEPGTLALLGLGLAGLGLSRRRKAA